jgi:site-specific DNA-methyltransferase (adenine-specific)
VSNISRDTLIESLQMSGIKPFFSTRNGAVYQTDCLTLLAALRDESVDMVFADPPFNIGKDYGNGSHHDSREEDEYLKWCFQWMDECQRVLKPGGSFFIYHLPQKAFGLAHHLDVHGMTFRHWIALSMKGTFPRGRKLYPAHYALLYFTKGEPATFNHVRLPIPACRHCGKDVKDYGGHRKYLNPLGLNLTDFWEDTSPARHSKFKARWHINELKPLIPSRCIQIATNEHGVVLDPFGGGGSTFEAAEHLNRYWIGSEILDCTLIRDRFIQNLPDVKEGTPRALAALLVAPNQHLELPNNNPCHVSSKRSTITARESASSVSGSRRSSTKSKI